LAFLSIVVIIATALKMPSGNSHVTDKSTSTRITVVALHPEVFRVIVFIFSQGKH
jgi:hypothetical protein